MRNRVSVDFGGVDQCLGSIFAASCAGDHANVIRMIKVMGPKFTMMTEKQLMVVVSCVLRAFSEFHNYQSGFKYLFFALRAIKHQPKDPIYLSLSLLLETIGFKEEAWETLTHCRFDELSEDEETLVVFMRMAQEAKEARKFRIAINLYDKLSQKTQDSAFLILLMECYMSAHRLSKAAEVLGVCTDMAAEKWGKTSSEYGYCMGAFGHLHVAGESYHSAHMFFEKCRIISGKASMRGSADLRAVRFILQSPWERRIVHKHKQRICAHCYKVGIADRTIMPCKGCTLNWYCNDDCRKADFEKHREYCNRWSRKYHYCMVCDPQGCKWRSRFGFCQKDGCEYTLCRHCACPRHGK